MDEIQEHYQNIAKSIIQSSTPEINLEDMSSVDNFGRGMDAFSLYSSVYLEIIAYEEDTIKQEQAATLLGSFNHHPVSYTHLTLPTICSV